jgi:hypothetical protein
VRLHTSLSLSETGSPASKSPREASSARDKSQAAFDFTGLDQTFALNRTEEQSLNMGGSRRESKIRE